MEYVSLHNHTDYSVLDAVIQVGDLVKAAKEKEMTHVALTDHGNISGMYQFMQECKHYGVIPIYGCEFYLNDKLERKPKRNHIVALARNQEGWKNLVKLNHLSVQEDQFYYKPRLTHQQVLDHASGLTILSSCLGSKLFDFVHDNDEAGAEKFVKEMQEATGGNFYIELIFNVLEQQKPYNRWLVNFSEVFNVPLVVSNDVHYLEEDDFILREITRMIGFKKTISGVDWDSVIKDMYFRMPEDIIKAAKDYDYDIPTKVIEEGIARTREVAEKIENVKVVLPDFRGPKLHSKEDADEKIEQFCASEFEKRILSRPKISEDEVKTYYKRLNHELNVIQTKNFSNYFLVMKDIVDFCKKEDIYYGVGRGSAVGSLISYLLDITKLDPIEHGLFFERFLSMARKEPPDVDMDFDSNRREEILKYLVEKYDSKNVAHVMTFGRFGTRGILRDIGRVFEFDGRCVSTIAKFVEDDKSIVKEMNRFLETCYSDKQVCDLIKDNSKYFELAEQLRGNIRHLSLHASGIVVDNAAFESVPLQKFKNRIVCGLQESGDHCEISGVGLVKLDILGLAACGVIYSAGKMIQERHGLTEIFDLLHNFDFNNHDYSEVFDLFNEGDCEGVFQFSSPSIKRFLERVHIEKFDDLVAVNALHRPATLMSGAADRYIARKHGEEEVTYIDERVKHILEPTYGIIAYQEQILQMLQVLGNFTLEQADEIRYSFKQLFKGVTGWAATKINKQIQDVVDKCIANGMSKEQGKEIYELLKEHSTYAFNKSHSAAYAWIGFQMMYLKKYFSLEFFCCLLNYHKGNMDKIYIYNDDAKRHGIKFLPVHINNSRLGFSIEEDSIRVGFDLLDGIGERVAAEIVRCQPYSSKEDMHERITKRIVNKRIMVKLDDEDVFECILDDDPDVDVGEKK